MCLSKAYCESWPPGTKPSFFAPQTDLRCKRLGRPRVKHTLFAHVRKPSRRLPNAMASLADALLADLGDEQAESQAPSSTSGSNAQEMETGHAAGQSDVSSLADALMQEDDASSSAAVSGNDNTDTFTPPREVLENGDSDTMKPSLHSMESARSVSKLYGSESLASMMQVRAH